MIDTALTFLAQAVFGQTETPDRLLDQPLRKRIVQIIRRKPGIHASELCRESGEAWGTVQYHLGLLRKSELVTSVEAGRERRFFPPDMDPQRARMLSLLNQGRRQEIVAFIREHPGIRQVDVCEAVRVSRKTFRASVRPLVEEGLIDERRGLQSNRYFAQDGLDEVLAGEPELPDGYV